MKVKIINWFSFFLHIAAYGLIWYAGGWVMSVGVFMVIWANNIDRSNPIR